MVGLNQCVPIVPGQMARMAMGIPDRELLLKDLLGKRLISKSGSLRGQRQDGNKKSLASV